MAQEIIMPKQGLQMTEGTIIKWLAKEGDAVKEGQPLFEMETDKLTITIDSTASGTLLKIVAGEGETIPVAQVIAYVGEPGEQAGAAAAQSAPAAEIPAAGGSTANTVIMPKQGLQMTEGTILHWLVEEGGAVQKGQPLFEMETDKLTITIDSDFTGTLLKIVHGEGDTVPVAQPIAYIGAPGDAIPAAEAEAPAPAEQAAAPAAQAAAPAQSAPGGERRFSTPRARWRAEEKGVKIDAVPGTGPEGLIIERDVLSFAAAAPRATPLAKKAAQSAGVDLAGITGSGPRGKITRSDVAAAAAPAAAEPAPAAPAAARGETFIPLSGMRKVVAERMKASLLEMAQANHRMSVDMTEAVRVREQLKARGVKVSYNDIIMRCTARALTEFPMMNASMAEDGIVVKHYVNMGMAVAVEGGLVVPVIRDADRKSLTEIAREAADLAARTKENRLQPDEYTGGTFTVSNLGMFGVDSFTAVINPPEAGILAVGKMAKTPVVEGDAIVIRPMLTLSLTYDHRVIDGAPAAQFLAKVKELLENPALLL